MNVLSLFNGISCGRVALERVGIPVERYVSYEIDKYANAVAQKNYPNDEYHGDVTTADFTQYKGFDLVIGGSPCTYWSIAQKNNRETEASGMGWELFSQYVRALKEVKPKFFLYENNKSMSKAIRESITETFGFEAICINSALVSAQNRQRLYWVGKRNADGTYSKVDVEQPEDRGILLRDVLDGVTDREKGRCVIASTGRTTEREYFKKNQGNMSFEPVGTTKDGKSYCLTSGYANGSGEKIGNYAAHTLTKGCKSMVAEPVCAEGGGMGAKTGLYAVPVEFDGDIPIKAVSGADGKTYIVYSVENGSIEIKGKIYPIKLKDGYYIIRKLTVKECMRLQTVPEWYEFPVSDSQSYKMLGNGWTVDVIAHILSFIKEE